MAATTGHLFFSEREHATVRAAMARLIPADPDLGAPGAAATGSADYVDGLLGAFMVDPPRIWAGGPFSGRHGGEGAFDSFVALGPLEELAWRTRIEGSLGLAAREFNGPVIGLQQRYREGLGTLDADFVDLDGARQDIRLDDGAEFKALLFEHACEATYGDPIYGGNRDGEGWRFIGFEGDVQPRGYSDTEVSEP